MKETLAVSALTALAFLAGCATAPPSSDSLGEPASPVRTLCENGKYQEAMRELPEAMAAWEEYTERTGRTAEGAAGFLYASTMWAIATKGDAASGKILDDPEIPYSYKTEMLFEILELRLGKGAVYVGNKSNFIVPRSEPADLDTEMIKLPE